MKTLLFTADGELERLSKTKVTAWATAVAALAGPFFLHKLGIDVDVALFEQVLSGLFALAIVFLREGIDRAQDKL